MVNIFDMKIHTVDKLISVSLLNSKSITLLELGGVEYLQANIEAVCTSRFLPEILKSIINEIERSQELERSKYENIFLSSLRFCNDVFSIQEVIYIVETIVTLFVTLKEPCFEICLEESKNIKKNSIVRSWFLEATFRFSLSDRSKRFKLISYLIDVSVDDSDVYLRHVAKIIGLSYSNWQEAELIDKLEKIKSIKKELDEVWFELGMSYLLIALNSETKEEALSNFILARDHFKKNIELDSERPDAIAYDASISILLSMSGSQLEIDRNENLDRLIKAITIYSAWHISENDNIWLSARNTEIANWFILINKLDNLLIHFTELCWFEPQIVIETSLLNVYTASRTILKRNHLGGLEKIIQPQIENNLRNNANYIFLLDQWVASQEGSELGEIGKKLKQEIKLSKTNISEGVFNLIPSITKLSINKQNEFEQFLRDYKSQNTNNISINVEKIFNEIIPNLSIISDFRKEDVKMGFSELLYLSLLFLISRMDGTKTNYKEFSYLFEQEKRPLEYELQKDYHQFMHSALFHGNTTIEKSDVASGRVDVYFSFARFNISAEIKRDWDDCSFEALKSKYLGQAAEYSNTDAKLGFLIVLDLTPKPNGIKSIESSVKVEIIEKKNDSIKRAIVVIVIPGMRKTPSEVKLKGSKTKKT